MIKVNKTEDGLAAYNIINYDYLHPSQNPRNPLNEDKFKNISWNLFFVKNKIPCFVLDNLEIKYSMNLKEGGNNYVVDSSFPHSCYGNKLIHTINDVFDPSYLETGHIMHFSSFMRFINFMLPPMDGEVIDIAKDVLYYQDPFKLSIICSYNVYSNLHAFHGYYGMTTKSTCPEHEWISESLIDGITYEEQLKRYVQKIIENGNKSNK